MRRSLVAILTLLYFAVSSGIVMNVHYCMGKRQSVSLNVLAAGSCACGKKMTNKKGCCKTESQLVKLNDVQKASYANFAVQAPVTEAAVSAFYTSWVPVPDYELLALPVEHSPPLLSKQHTYLLNSVFRI